MTPSPIHYIFSKDCLKSEFSWLFRDFHKGEVVTRFDGATYGCCSGVPILETFGQYSGCFVDIPEDCLEPYKMTVLDATYFS